VGNSTGLAVCCVVQVLVGPADLMCVPPLLSRGFSVPRHLVACRTEVPSGAPGGIQVQQETERSARKTPQVGVCTPVSLSLFLSLLFIHSRVGRRCVPISLVDVSLAAAAAAAAAADGSVGLHSRAAAHFEVVVRLPLVPA